MKSKAFSKQDNAGVLWNFQLPVAQNYTILELDHYGSQPKKWIFLLEVLELRCDHYIRHNSDTDTPNAQLIHV